MKVKIINQKENKMTFLLEDTSPQFANALRRIAMVEVPNLAVETADFDKNESAMYDEVIAHRLAMIPLTFNPKDMNMKSECKCEGKGCSLCEVVLVINKKGPCTIYSKDMKSSNSDVKPLYENIPIIDLAEDQTLKLEATAVMGLGKIHAKFNSAIAFYRYYPEVKLEGQLKNADECMKICPKNALEFKGSKAIVTEDCDLCQECVHIANPSVLKVTGDNRKFIFTVESISALSAQEIIMSAIKILKEKAQELEKQIKKI